MKWITEPRLQITTPDRPPGLKPGIENENTPDGTVVRNSETGERWVFVNGAWHPHLNESQHGFGRLEGLLEALLDTERTQLRVLRSIQHGIAILAEEELTEGD